jgi:hypothetical protein
MWDSSCFVRFLEMRSAFIEVRAIREDLNARRRKGEHPENRCYESALSRWHDAIAALADCLYSRKSALLVTDLSPLVTSQLAEKGAGSDSKRDSGPSFRAARVPS